MRRRMKQAATMGPECSHGKWPCLIGTSSTKIVIFCGYVNFPEGIHNPQIMVVKLWLALSPHIYHRHQTTTKNEAFLLEKMCFWCFFVEMKETIWMIPLQNGFTNQHSHLTYTVCTISVYLSICWSIYLSIDLCMRASSACIPCLLPPPIHPSIHPSTHPPIHRSIDT